MTIAAGENRAAPAHEPTRDHNPLSEFIHWANYGVNVSSQILCLMYVKSFAPMYALCHLIGETEQFGFGDGLYLQDFAEDGVLHRTIHADQRYGFGAARCFAPSQGEGGDVYA